MRRLLLETVAFAAIAIGMGFVASQANADDIGVVVDGVSSYKTDLQRADWWKLNMAGKQIGLIARHTVYNHPDIIGIRLTGDKAHADSDCSEGNGFKKKASHVDFLSCRTPVDRTPYLHAAALSRIPAGDVKRFFPIFSTIKLPFRISARSALTLTTPRITSTLASFRVGWGLQQPSASQDISRRPLYPLGYVRGRVWE